MEWLGDQRCHPLLFVAYRRAMTIRQSRNRPPARNTYYEVKPSNLALRRKFDAPTLQADRQRVQ